MKTFYKILAMLALVLCFAGTALAVEKEVSSIDAIDMGVADTGETHFTNTDAEITESRSPIPWLCCRMSMYPALKGAAAKWR